MPHRVVAPLSSGFRRRKSRARRSVVSPVDRGDPLQFVEVTRSPEDAPSAPLYVVVLPHGVTVRIEGSKRPADVVSLLVALRGAGLGC
jgi:hypothetical protein